MARLFGTDGIRGIANRDLTAELALRLGWAGASLLSQKEPGKILIGRDTRVSSEMLESAMIAGIASTGAEAVCLGVMPTGAIAWLVKRLQADAGIVISASHNPYEYNGIKFFSADGYKLSDEDEDRIEVLLRETEIFSGPVGAHIGRRSSSEEATRLYFEHCLSVVKNRFNGVKIAIDCANGAAYKIAPALFAELGADTILVGVEPDGLNINDRCGSTHPLTLQTAVIDAKADIGLAYDGDADRLIAVDEHGTIIDGDFVLAFNALAMKEENTLSGNTVVTTVMSNLGFDRAMRLNGIEVVKTKVGDRYVLEEMLKRGFCLGGEQSGHVIFLSDCTTGDGLITSLHLVDRLISKNLPLSSLTSLMEKWPQVLVNVTVSQKDRLQECERVWDLVRHEEERLAEQGRILVRASGTEPLVRVMVEAQDDEKANAVAEAIAEIVEQELG